jgi:hypothetical protein
VARESSQVHNEAWESSQVHNVSYGISVILSLGSVASLIANAFSTQIIPTLIKVKIKKAKTSVVRRVPVSILEDWFERNGVKKEKTVIVYKRVSKDFKTQEGTERETTWLPGTTVTHPNYDPKREECGGGKYHACSRPFFCDEFRHEKADDRYVAIEVTRTKKVSGHPNLYPWPKNAGYPYKVGFGEGSVLYECDKYGKKLGIPTQ